MQIAARSIIRFVVWLLLLGVILIGGGIALYTQSRSPAAARAAAVATYYVSPVGLDDPASGSSGAAPFKTLQYALDRVPCGSTIRLAAGIYTEDIDVNRADCLMSTGRTVCPRQPLCWSAGCRKRSWLARAIPTLWKC